MKAFERALEDIASKAEKFLGEQPQKDMKPRRITKSPKVAPFLWLRHIAKDLIFNKAVKHYIKRANTALFTHQLKERAFQQFVVDALEYLCDHTDAFVDAGETFADDYSRELLVKFFALRLNALTGYSPKNYITPTELTRSRGDFITWQLSIRRLPIGWKAMGFVFYGAPPEPPGLLYLHGLRERDIDADPNSVFVDVGAYIGDSALPMSFYFGRVIAFEPYPENLHFLQKNITGANNIEVRPVALGSEPGKAKLIPDKNGVTGAVEALFGEKGTVTVTTLDLALKDTNLGERAVIKMDVEGAERDVLLGGKKIIRDATPQLVVCAYHLPDDIPTLLDIMEKLSNEYVFTFRHHFRWGPNEFVIIAKPSL